MDNSTIFLLAVVALLAGCMAVFLFATARRRDAGQRAAEARRRASSDGAEAADRRLPVPVGAAPRPSGRELERAVALERRAARSPPPTPRPPRRPRPPDEESLGVTRRQVLNRGIVATMTLAISRLRRRHASPCSGRRCRGGFGSKIRAGKFDEIMDEIADKKEPFYVGAGRFYISPYPKDGVAKAKGVTAYAAVLEGYEQGVVALYQKCPHLGCRVPWCKTSQWFECPCHGSQYNRVGEKKGGPAPRGMDRFVGHGRGRRSSSSTPRPSSPARRSAPTPPARSPRAPTASVPSAGTDVTQLLAVSSPAADRPRRRPGHAASAGSSTSSARPGAPTSPAPSSTTRPTASRTTTTRAWRASASPSTCGGRSPCWPSPPSACPSTGCASPSARPAPASTGARRSSRRRRSSGASGSSRPRPATRPRPASPTSAARPATARRASAVWPPTPSADPVNPDALPQQVQWAAPAAQHGDAAVPARGGARTSSSTAGPARRCRPWGVEGGGALNDQQIDDLIAYLEHIKLDPSEVKEENLAGVRHRRARSSSRASAPAATPRASPTASPACRAAAPSGPPSPAAPPSPVPRPSSSQLDVGRRDRASTASTTACGASARASCRYFGNTLTASRSRPSSTTSGPCDAAPLLARPLGRGKPARSGGCRLVTVRGMTAPVAHPVAAPGWT